MLRERQMQNQLGLSDPAIEEALYGRKPMRALAGLMAAKAVSDETIIAAPGSLKTATGERDHEMHQTKQGDQWYFEMKGHIDVGAGTWLAHTVATTTTYEANVQIADEMLDGKELVAHADCSNPAVDKWIECRALKWPIAAECGCVKALQNASTERALERRKKTEAGMRANVEHPFRAIKR